MKRLIRLALFLLVSLVAAAGGSYFWLLRDLPAVTEIEARTVVPSVRIVDRHGRLLYEVIDETAGRHARLSTEQIPDPLRWATIATEDRNFYRHPGVDLAGIARAAWINFQGGEVLAGGSTITQQLARNLLLDTEERRERTLRRKLRESWLAWRLARTYTKDEILNLYLNQTYYGGLSYGVEAAAQTFFGRSARELTLAQSALLAGLPQAPAFYNPLIDPVAAKQRQEIVLDLLHQEGFISQVERDQAAREPLPYATTPYPIEAPHFVTMVQAELDRLVTQEDLRRMGGVTVQTTLDLDWQRAAERAVREQVTRLNRPRDGGVSHRVTGGALVALDPHTGDLLTLVGSPDFFDEQNGGAINMALVPRQPGSTLKPIFYAAAMDPRRPQPLTAASLRLDVRTTFMTREGESYIPVNFSRTEHGPVLVRQALGASLNIPAVLTLDEIGVAAGLAQMRDLGVEPYGPAEDYDLSMALGGGAVRLLDLTRAYGVFANGGERLAPRLILSLESAGGETLYTAPETRRARVLDERIAWLISDILSDNEARRLSFGPFSILNVGRPAAAKTGTTNDFHDNWTIGYTPELVVGVWVGNVDNTPMANVTGITGAGPIWHRFVRTVLAGRPAQPFTRPEGMVSLEICALSGLLPTPDCPLRRQEWFIRGTEPRQPDHFFRRVPVDRATGYKATAGTPPQRVEWEVVLDLPPAAHGWARANGLTLLGDLLVGGDVDQQQSITSEPAVALRSPSPGLTYRLSPQLPEDAQRLPLELVGNVPLQNVSFYLDGDLLVELYEPPFRIFWPLVVGEHELRVEATTVGGEPLQVEPVRFTVDPPELESSLEEPPASP